MSWTRVKATGYGKLAFRLSIDGAPWDAVTDVAMTSTGITADNGRVRRLGLRREGLRDDWDAVLERGTAKGKGMSVKIADPRQTWYSYFSQVPTASTWLDVDASTSATTITPKSTGSFSNGDVIYMGTEAIVIGTITGGDFTGCTRGAFNSVRQYHYAGDGELLTHSEITNKPRTLESRLARLYVYGEGDSASGDGTQVWLGVVSTEPKLVDPVNWEFTIDPISRMLQQPFGADLGGEITPRGAYRPHPFLYRFKRYAGAGSPHGGTGVYTSAQQETVNGVVDAGHYETQADWCKELQDEVNNVTGPAFSVSGVTWIDPGCEVKAFEDGWEIWWQGDSTWTEFLATERYEGAYIVGGADYLEGGWAVPQKVMPEGSTTPEPFSQGTTRYRAIPSSEGYGSRESRGGEGRGYASIAENYDGQRTFPRGYFGPETFAVSFPGNRIYLDTSMTLDATEFDACYIFWPDTNSGALYDITAADNTARYIEVTPKHAEERHLYFKESLPTIRLTRQIGSGNVGDLVSGITDNAARYANKGAVPWLTREVMTITGLSGWTPLCNEHCNGKVLLNSRLYYSTKPVRFDKYLAEELKLASLMLGVDVNGRMVPKRIHTPTAQNPDLTVIDNDDVLLNHGMPTWEPSAIGSLHTVELSPYYDNTSGKHFKPTIVMTDVRSRAKNQLGQTLKVKPYSDYTGWRGRPFMDAHPINELYALFQPTLRLLGGAYAVVEITTSLRFAEDPGIGEGVLLTCDHLPDWDSGGPGMTQWPCIVIGRTREWDRGIVRFRLLGLGEPITGYTPSLGITDVVSGSGYGTYTLSVSIGDPLLHASWEYPEPGSPSGDNIADYWAAGDRIAVSRWNDGGSTVYTGTIDSVLTSSSYTTGGRLRVDFDSDEAAPNLTIAGQYWVIDFANANDDLVAAQEKWAFYADEEMVIGFSTGGDKPARKYG